MTNHKPPTAANRPDPTNSSVSPASNNRTPGRAGVAARPLRVMVDMDGVLADFVASCAVVFKRLFPDNARIDPRVRSYSFWVDEWGIDNGRALIDQHCHEVFSQAPNIDPIVWVVGQLNPRLFQAEVVTHLWGGNDRRLQETCLEAKRAWLVDRGLGHLPIRPVRGIEPVKKGPYDIVLEDSPKVLLNADRLGHERTLRILIHRGWQSLPDRAKGQALNLVVLRPDNYWLLPWVIVSYWFLGRSVSRIQTILDRRTANPTDQRQYPPAA